MIICVQFRQNLRCRVLWLGRSVMECPCSDATKLGVLGKRTDTRNVVAPSPARTVWVQIPPGANFFRCRCKQIHLFTAKYRPYAFFYALIRVMWLHLRPPELCGFKSHQVPTFSGVGNDFDETLIEYGPGLHPPGGMGGYPRKVPLEKAQRKNFLPC